MPAKAIGLGDRTRPPSRKGRRRPRRATPRPYRLAYIASSNSVAVDADTRLYSSLSAFEGSVFHQGDPPFFTVPATRDNVLALESVATPDSVGESYRVFRDRLMSFPTPWAVAAEEWCGLARPLMPHQLQFIEMAAAVTGMMNGSEQGTGKTSPALVLSKSLGARRVVVLCPKTLPDEWMREQSKLWPSNEPFQVADLTTGTLSQRRGTAEALADDPFSELGAGPTIAFVNYEALAALVEPLIRWRPDILWVDESWRIKNPRAMVTMCAMALRDASSRGYPMAGTVIGNDVGDIWSQLYIADPRALGGMDYDTFLQRFANFRPVNTARGAMMVPDGVSDPAGLMRLLGRHWHRAVKSTCLDLPPKQYRPVTIELSKESRELYDAVKQDGESALGGDPLSLAGDRVIRLRLHQIAGGHRPVPSGELPDGRTVYSLEEMKCSKVEWLLDWAADHMGGSGETRTIVWVRFNAEGHRITRELERVSGPGSAVFAWRGTKRSELEAWKDSFNSRDPNGVRWLVCQTAKMAAGQNLQAGDHHLYHSNTYSHLLRSQSEDRSHRAGREGREAVTYWDEIAQGTIDEEIIETLQRKESLATRLQPATAGDTLGEEGDGDTDDDATGKGTGD